MLSEFIRFPHTAGYFFALALIIINVIYLSIYDNLVRNCFYAVLIILPCYVRDVEVCNPLSLQFLSLKEKSLELMYKVNGCQS